MHCHLHYETPHLERHEQPKHKMCSLLLSALLLVGNLKRSPGINTSLALSNFIRHKNATFKSNQPNLLIRVPGFPGSRGGGGYSQKNWVGLCGLLPKTLTLFMTKICDIPYPIYDLTKNSKSNLWPDPHIKILFQTGILISSVVQTNFKLS